MTRRRLIIGALAIAAVAILAISLWRLSALSNRMAVLTDEAKRLEQVAESRQSALEEASGRVKSAEAETAQALQDAKESDEKLKAAQGRHRLDRSRLEARTREAEQQARRIEQDLEQSKADVSNLTQDELAAEVEGELQRRDALARFLLCEGGYCANQQAAVSIRRLQLDFTAAIGREAGHRQMLEAARGEVAASDALQAACLYALDTSRAALQYAVTRDDLRKAENKALADLLATREAQAGNYERQLKTLWWKRFWKKPKELAIQAALLKLAYEAGQRSK